MKKFVVLLAALTALWFCSCTKEQQTRFDEILHPRHDRLVLKFVQVCGYDNPILTNQAALPPATFAELITSGNEPAARLKVYYGTFGYTPEEGDTVLTGGAFGGDKPAFESVSRAVLDPVVRIKPDAQVFLISTVEGLFYVRSEGGVPYLHAAVKNTFVLDHTFADMADITGFVTTYADGATLTSIAVRGNPVSQPYHRQAYATNLSLPYDGTLGIESNRTIAEGLYLEGVRLTCGMFLRDKAEWQSYY